MQGDKSEVCCQCLTQHQSGLCRQHAWTITGIASEYISVLTSTLSSTGLWLPSTQQSAALLC